MFCIDPNERPTANECMTHEWFKKVVDAEKYEDCDEIISNEILTSLKLFTGKSRLRRECLQILAKIVNPKEFQSLRVAFNRIDTNNSGTIEINELRTAVESHHSNLDKDELERIIKEIDFGGDGVINYHEFIAAVFPVEKYATRERLQSLFTKFDMKNKANITGKTLKDAFSKLGHNMTDQEVEEIMNEHDVDNDHQITFDEFKKMILDDM